MGRVRRTGATTLARARTDGRAVPATMQQAVTATRATTVPLVRQMAKRTPAIAPTDTLAMTATMQQAATAPLATMAGPAHQRRVLLVAHGISANAAPDIEAMIVQIPPPVIATRARTVGRAS